MSLLCSQPSMAPTSHRAKTKVYVGRSMYSILHCSKPLFYIGQSPFSILRWVCMLSVLHFGRSLFSRFHWRNPHSVLPWVCHVPCASLDAPNIHINVPHSLTTLRSMLSLHPDHSTLFMVFLEIHLSDLCLLSLRMCLGHDSQGASNQ